MFDRIASFLVACLSELSHLGKIHEVLLFPEPVDALHTDVDDKIWLTCI